MHCSLDKFYPYTTDVSWTVSHSVFIYMSNTMYTHYTYLIFHVECFNIRIQRPKQQYSQISVISIFTLHASWDLQKSQRETRQRRRDAEGDISVVARGGYGSFESWINFARRWPFCWGIERKPETQVVRDGARKRCVPVSVAIHQSRPDADEYTRRRRVSPPIVVSACRVPDIKRDRSAEICITRTRVSTYPPCL